MCGILGRVSSDAPIDRAVFAGMLETLVARGPDGSGTQILDEGRVGLGHRRLSIIDLSDAGAQPMSNENGTIWLTFNGEIYNFRELRSELEASGHRFRSQSDSEVIVHGYEEWGDDCVTRFRGIFAFGIWDIQRRRLLLARDHLGVKPLYYTTDPRDFTFASQPRALVEDPTFERRLDLPAFRDYLAYGVIPWDRAIFRGMAKLPAAHRLVLEDGAVRIERYWQLRYEPTLTDATEAERMVRAKLEEVLHTQMVSDVPVGVFLSGGIDSSLVTAIASQHEQEVLNTFTIGFEEAKKDERAFANLVVELLKTKHHERVLDFTTARQLIPDLVECYDEPFYYSSAFPTYYVSKLAQSSGMKVILGGDGGDELFAGYTRYDEFHRSMTQSWPDRLADGARRLLRGQRPLDPRSNPMLDYFRYEGQLNGRAQRPLLAEAARRDLDPDVAWRLRRFYHPEYPPVAGAQVVDLHCFLADEILSKVDRASMACGVEVRVPLLDPELVELAFRISSDVIYHRGERKSLLKQSVRDLLPPTVLTARKKGFSTPMNDWMRRGLLEHGTPLLLDGRLVAGGVLDRAGVAHLIANGSPKRVWLLLVAELWARRWLEDESNIGSLFPDNPRLWDRDKAGQPGTAH